MLSPMLIQISIPGSLEADLNFASDIGKKEFACDWRPGAETWEKCSHTDQPWSECKRTVGEGEMNNDDPCSSNFPRSYSQVSTYSAVSGNSTPAFVYHRRKPQRNFAAMCPAKTSNAPTFVYHRRKPRANSASMCPAQTSTNTKISDGFHSVISSEAHSVATKEHKISDVLGKRKSIDVLRVQCSTRAIDSKSESFTGCPVRERPSSEETLRNNNPGALDTCCIIDSCSSSKSNLDLDSAPLKTDVEDLGECSSSSALAADRLQDEMSERAVCISVKRSPRLLEKAPPTSVRGSAEDAGVSRDNCRSLSCKACEHLEKTSKMIACDNCEDAFHLSCCKPLVEEMPEDEWFCDSCMKKKHKILKEKSTSVSPNISSEIDRERDLTSEDERDLTSEDETGPISLMLKDTEPYTSNVRMGSEFQAEVPDWSGPIVDEVDPVGEPLEISVADNLHDSNCKRLPRISSIGNWLQCREVVEGIGEGVEGTICGKWRRAPLFEVQTDNWECFRCILWDPYHADCAVPQELDTDEVIKQLKYIEMLRPRLAAKRRKLDRTKPVGSQGLTEV